MPFPLFIDRESDEESKSRSCNDDFSYTKLANPAMIQSNFGTVHSQPSASAFIPGSLIKSSGSNSSACRKRDIKANGLESLRGGLLTEGISARATELIIKASKGGTSSNYESSWGKWVCWCSEQQVDPFACDLKFVLDFLAFLFEKNYEYSSINVHRSALSAYHKKVDNYPVGQYPKVCSLMTGIFNERPPKPNMFSSGTLNRF